LRLKKLILKINKTKKMKRAISYNILIIIIVIICRNSLAYPGKVVKSFPLPGKFCTGMTYDGHHLWVADYKEDMIYKIDPVSGAVLHQIPSPGFWPMGLAWDGQYLWNVDKKQKKIFKIDLQDGTILAAIDAPCNNPEGLTWHTNTLWVGDDMGNTIMKIDLSDGTAVKKFDGPARSVNGLTSDGKYLWSSDRYIDEIYMIDPESGEVFIIIDSPRHFSRGLAWDGKYLWNVDYQNDSLYQFIRQDEETFQISDTRKARITFTHQVKVYGQGKLKNLDVFISIPDDIPQQKVLDKSFSPESCVVKKDRWQQSVASFNYTDILSNETVQSIMEVKAEVSAIRYFIFPDNVGTLESIPQEVSGLYTANGSKYMIDDPYIQKLAGEITGDETNPYMIARRIFNYVRNNLEYKLEGGWNVAPVVLQRGTGSCSEYTFSFISLCRAAGLPARYAGALVVRGDDASLDEYFHRWPEIYLPNYGWVPIDPQGGDKPSFRDQAKCIGNLSNRFLITTKGGGDSEYLGWYYNHNEKYETEPQVKINVEAFGEWEPLLTTP
jgi:transglutaminase-like putative cysteine protease